MLKSQDPGGYLFWCKGEFFWQKNFAVKSDEKKNASALWSKMIKNPD